MTLSACSVYLDLKIEKCLTCTLFLHSAGGQVGEEAADPGLGIPVRVHVVSQGQGQESHPRRGHLEHFNRLFLYN